MKVSDYGKPFVDSQLEAAALESAKYFHKISKHF